MRKRTKCYLCGKLARMPFSPRVGKDICATCIAWYRKVGDPILEYGKRFIWIKIGSETVVYNIKRKVFESCTCKGELYANVCRHKKLSLIYFVAIGLLDSELMGDIECQ